MARLITDLAAATTPLAGTELAWVEQGGLPKKVAVSEFGGGAAGTPHDIVGDINMATPPVAAAFTGLVRIVDNDESDVIGTFGYESGAQGELIIENYVRFEDIVFNIADFNGAGSPFEVLRMHKGNSAAAGQEGYIMANRGIFNYLGTFTISNPDPPLMVTTGAGEDGQTANYLGIWNNAIQRFTAGAAGQASLSINSVGGDVSIGASSGDGGVAIYRDGSLKIGANTSATAVYFPNTSATAPSGGTVGADNALELSTSSQSPIARIGVRASDDVAYLGHDIHSQPWVIEGQNHNGSDRQIMKLYPGDGTDFGVEIGSSVSLGAGALWIYEIAASMTDKAGYGQFWVNTDVPNRAVFTGDTGVDRTLVGQEVAETISGQWTHTADAYMYDNEGWWAGTGNDARFYHNGTNTLIDNVGAANNFYIRVNSSETAILCRPNAEVEMYYNGVLELQTQDSNASGNTSGLEINDHSQTLRDVGFNVLADFSWDTSDTLEAQHCGAITGFKITTASADMTLTLAASGDTDFPVDGVVTIMNGDDTWDVVIAEGSGTTLYFVEPGSGLVDTTGGCDVGPGGVATIRRESTTVYHIWGSEITYTA